MDEVGGGWLTSHEWKGCKNLVGKHSFHGGHGREHSKHLCDLESISM